MISLTEKDIRESLINVSVRERNAVALPADFADTAWQKLDYFGVRDRKLLHTGYVVVELDDAPVGILVKQAEARPFSRAQCSWCEDVQLPNEVVLFGTKRVGAAGRKGDTLATLICANFECSRNVRKQPVSAYVGFDVEAEKQRRIAVLREHARNFVRSVRDGS